jgi:hypothetical protein
MRLLANVRMVDTADPRIVEFATELIERYRPHGAHTADMLIAAAALAQDRILISTNWADFHFVDGLWLLDARYLHAPPPTAPILARAPPPHRGPVLPAPRCCRGLVDAGVLPRMA